MTKVYSFEKLKAYHLARELAGEIYRSTLDFPKHELFGLSNQIRRASVSVSSNLAEGSGKRTAKEKARYTGISYSSLLEVLSQLQIALDLEYISNEKYLELRITIERLTYLLTKLRAAQLNLPKPP